MEEVPYILGTEEDKDGFVNIKISMNQIIKFNGSKIDDFTVVFTEKLEYGLTKAYDKKYKILMMNIKKHKEKGYDFRPNGVKNNPNRDLGRKENFGLNFTEDSEIGNLLLKFGNLK